MNGVSIIIPVKNGEEFLEPCLFSISNQTNIDFDFEIIVVDNESTDNTRNIAKKFDVKLITSMGKSAAAVRNDGAECAQFEIIGFLDADCVVPDNWVISAYQLFEKDNGYGCVGGGCFADPEGTWVQKAWALSNPVPAGNVNALPGSCILFKKDFFQQIGQFNTLLISAEDDEICSRVILSGKKIYRDNKLWVIHLDYPKCLSDHFSKSRWHGASQIAAHGFFGDNLVVLTWVWGLCILSALLSVFINGSLATIFLGVSLLLPLIFALKRLRINSVFHQNLRYLLQTYIICFVVMGGRLLGMMGEILDLLKKTGND